MHGERRRSLLVMKAEFGCRDIYSTGRRQVTAYFTSTRQPSSRVPVGQCTAGRHTGALVIRSTLRALWLLKGEGCCAPAGGFVQVQAVYRDISYGAYGLMSAVCLLSVRLATPESQPKERRLPLSHCGKHTPSTHSPASYFFPFFPFFPFLSGASASSGSASTSSTALLACLRLILASSARFLMRFRMHLRGGQKTQVE